MDGIKEITLNACVSLLIGEIIYFLTPKDKIIENVYSLMYTLIIGLSIFTALNLEYSDFIYSADSAYQEEIDSMINEYYMLSTETELKSMIVDALDVVNIEVNDIETVISVYDDEIIIENISITLKYKYDIDNAKTIIQAVFGGVIPMEVTGEI